MEQRVLLCRAQSIIERDALLSELKSQGIEALGPHRDISRKMTDTTVDLAYDGYSAMFDGFPILVPEADLQRSQDLLKGFQERIRRETSSEESPSLPKFYFCSLFTMIAPVLMHIFAIYHLLRGWKRGEKLRPLFAVFSFTIYSFTLTVLVYALSTANFKDIHLWP